MNTNDTPKGRPGLLRRAARPLCALAAFDRRFIETVGRRLGPRRASVLLVALSLAFAAAIVAVPLLLGQGERNETLVFLLIAAWWIPFSVLSAVTTTYRDGCCGRTSSRP